MPPMKSGRSEVAISANDARMTITFQNFWCFLMKFILLFYSNSFAAYFKDIIAGLENHRFVIRANKRII